MTTGRTSEARTRKTREMENHRHRIILENRDLQILDLQSRKPPGMEGKCMRCGKHEHQPGQRCPAKNAKCKKCHKLDISTKCARAGREPTLFKPPQDDDNTHIDENGVRQPNPPPRVNMLKVVNHIEANRGKFNEGKHLKFPIVSHPRGPYNHHMWLEWILVLMSTA